MNSLLAAKDVLAGLPQQVNSLIDSFCIETLRSRKWIVVLTSWVDYSNEV